MDLTSFGFLLFLGLCLFLYYTVPGRFRMYILLALSLIFVASYNITGIIFILLSALCIWFCGRKMADLNAAFPPMDGELKKRKRRFVILSVIFNLGILFILKYLGDFLGLRSQSGNPFRILIPIGLSYYTLQALGYVLDVYWNRIPAENSYSKLLLFLCYFPQMIQGPVSRYKELSPGLFSQEKFQLHNVKHGVQLMLWGYFKVLAVAGSVEEFVNMIFYSGQTAYGLTVLIGFILFGIQLYCNFSGGIDIVRGVSQCFGIELPENFTQPFFSRSLGEFWRRWHITLGAWMKDYVFFPFSMSKPMSRLKKKLKTHMSRKMANRIPIAIGNIVVFLLVGIWHGTGTNFALWGLYNGIILAFSELMAEPFLKAKTALRIDEDSRAWNVFCLLRTFLIVTLGWCTDCASTFSGSLQLVANMFMLSQTNPGIIEIKPMAVKLLISLVILITVDILHEKKISIREFMDKKPLVLQMLFWTAVIQYIALFRNLAAVGGFMYAEF